MNIKFFPITLVIILLAASCGKANKPNNGAVPLKKVVFSGEVDTATFAGGCFWCTEAVFERVEGVVDVVSGYSGGTAENADYRKVSNGITNHAECVQIYYDKQVVSYEELVEIFFATHDPTQLNRQGPDVGRQYRSEVFYRTEEEKKITERHIEKLNKSGKYSRGIVTLVSPLETFYEAEEYHQDFYELNPYQGYILAIAKPKVKKLFKLFPEFVKEKYKEDKG